jgi:hypothetical protein
MLSDLTWGKASRKANSAVLGLLEAYDAPAKANQAIAQRKQPVILLLKDMDMPQIVGVELKAGRNEISIFP